MITVNSISRLGNRIFQVSALMGIAKKRNYDYVLIKKHFTDLYEYFENMNIPQVRKFEGMRISDRSDNPKTDFFDIPDNTIIDGYFQNEKYFSHIAEEIRHTFTPKREFIIQASNIISVLNIGATIHVRGTDYKNVGLRLSEQTYKDCYDFLKQKTKKNIGIVTDDVEYAKRIFPDSNYILSNTPIIDFTILYLSDMSIVLNSTFSFWSRWLSNKKTYVHKKMQYKYGCTLDWEIADLSVKYS
jgi:hypothetical protein